MDRSLTTEELIELVTYTVTTINAQFELWITITFAVIIASYIAGHKLSRSLQYLIATLYALVSVLLFAMLVGAVRFMGRFDAGGLFASEVDLLQYFIGLLRVVVWVLGSVATLIFIFKGQNEPQRE